MSNRAKEVELECMTLQIYLILNGKNVGDIRRIPRNSETKRLAQQSSRLDLPRLPGLNHALIQRSNVIGLYSSVRS
jgi:hypothetical protein